MIDYGLSTTGVSRDVYRTIRSSGRWFERQRREIAAIDAIVDELVALRENRGMSKAELARAIGKNPAAIRRLLTASDKPGVRTVVAIADVLGAKVQIVPWRRAPASRYPAG